MTARRLTILLVEQQTVVREGVSLLIERALPAVVTQAGSLAEAKGVGEPPDVIVTGLHLEDAQGAGVVRALSGLFPGSPLVVLSHIDAPGDVREALEAGARGYVLREAAAEELLLAIRTVLEGGDYLQPALGAATARGLGHEPSAALSPREREVLHLLALGHTHSEIASAIGLSVRTVETHRAHIVQKLGLRTRAELVRFAIDAGLLEAD